MQTILAIDFGGTKHTLGICDAAAVAWKEHRRVHTGVGVSAQSDLEIIFREAVAMLDSMKPAAIGISFGGPVDHVAGIVRLSHHVPNWEGTPLLRLFEERFDAPVTVDNDANAGALGEFYYGAAQGTHSALYVTVSTGVGGGWVLDGRVWHGADGMAGEIGHMVVEPEGPLCLCGKRGCVERLASGPYMALDAADLLATSAADKGRYLRERVAVKGMTGELIAEAAANGDDVANEILERGARAIGVGLGNATNLMNPEVIVLGGGVTKSGPDWWRIVRETAQAIALPQVGVRVLPAALGDDAPLWGAVAMARQHLR